jgi:hypothetical protein
MTGAVSDVFHGQVTLPDFDKNNPGEASHD